MGDKNIILWVVVGLVLYTVIRRNTHPAVPAGAGYAGYPTPPVPAVGANPVVGIVDSVITAVGNVATHYIDRPAPTAPAVSTNYDLANAD
jgi:hypothetical protein